MKKYRYVHHLLFAVLFYGSTVSMSAQKFVDVTRMFRDDLPVNSILVDTTGFVLLDSMPKDKVIERTYAKVFKVYAWKEHNPCKDIGGELPRCVTGLTMNTSTTELQNARDSAAYFYPNSVWCEESRYENVVGIGIQLETVEKQGTFFDRFSPILQHFVEWIIPEPVSVDEEQGRPSSDGFMVYPNPASTSMTVTSSVQSTGATKRLKIQLYDALGQHVADAEINDGESIDVSALDNGAYRAVISAMSGPAQMGSIVVQFIVNR